MLLRIIAGFEALDGGSMRIGSEVVADAKTGAFLPAEQRSLGVVFQDYAVWPHMTVRQNVGYPLKIAKTNPAEAAALVQKSIDDVNLTGMEDRLPSQLSGGQQQRVALARALVAQPSLLLLDEPLNNLDANLREEMRFEIKTLQKNLGVTILYVTHDQEIALAISDRMAVMDAQGALRQVGTPTELFARPVDEFVFSFLGMSNFLHVRVQNRCGRIGRPSLSPFARSRFLRRSTGGLSTFGRSSAARRPRAAGQGASGQFFGRVYGLPVGSGRAIPAYSSGYARGPGKRPAASRG